MNVLGALTSIFFFLYPLHISSHDHQVDYLQESKKYNGSACWKSYNGQIIFSSNITGAKNKSFDLISKKGMFITSINGSTDTMHVKKDNSDLLKIIEIGRRAAAKGTNNHNSTYRIVTTEGNQEIEMKIQDRIIEIRPKNEQYLLKNFAKELTVYVNPSTDDFITGWEIDKIPFMYLGYTPLNENGEPLFKF